MNALKPALRGDRGVVAALCAAQFMLIVDVVVIYLALPSMSRDLAIPSEHQHLVGVAYTLTFGSLLVVFGRTGDLLGRRRVLLAGPVVFTAASLGAALAVATWHLLLARTCQGLGAAMVSANALAAINDRFEEGAGRNAILGLWAAVGSVGAIAGQLLGGLITDTVGWRFVFLVNVPVGAVVIAILARRLPTTTIHGDRRLDLAGSALLAAGLACLAGALAGRSALLAVAAAVLLVAFAFEERRASAPVLPLGLLRLSGVRVANVTLFLNAGGLGATLFFVALYLQNVLGMSPLAVSLVFAPVTLIVLVLSPHAGALVTRVGVRVLLTTGLAMLAAGMFLLGRAPVDGDLIDVVPGMLLLAVGSGISYAPTFIAASSGVANADQGAASGLITSMQELGTAACLALLALVSALAAPAAGDAAGLAQGYRAGIVGAGVLLAIAALVALTAPRGLGRATLPSPERPAPPREPASAS